MLLQITHKAYRFTHNLHSLYQSTQPIRQFQSLQTAQCDLSNFHTHLLQTHQTPHSIHQVHAQIITTGSSKSSFTATHLVKSYAKAGNLKWARLVFESVHKKRVFLWNSMIRACSVYSLWSEIVELYVRMEGESVVPDHYTLPFVAKAFGVLCCVEEGKRVHDVAKRIGIDGNVYVGTALVEMYVEFGEVGVAYDVFDEMPVRDVVAWTSMISGFVDHGKYWEAVKVFRDMRLGECKPNWVTVLSVIPACDFDVHSFVVKLGFDFCEEVQTAMLNMYVKGGKITIARNLFDEMLEKNLVSWTVMVSGYSQNGCAEEALSLFYEMLTMSDHEPDSAMAASVSQACAQLGSLSCGEMMHGYFVQTGSISELSVETALVDMYAKCGSIRAAQRVFDGIQCRNLVTWSALIAGYGYHGFGSKALDLFEQMKSEGFTPDETVFLSVLSACSHSGLVFEGKEYFNLMRKAYNVIPGTKHYACMIDLLGRAGLVDEALDLIKRMPVEADANVWGALLSSCKTVGNVKVAEYASKRLFELESDSPDYHVLLANIYAGCGKWDDVSSIRSVIRSKGEKKTPGCSFVEVNCQLHTFLAKDMTHPKFDNIISILKTLHTSVSDNQWMLA
ncbi:hypothetical protein Syun_020016 [Stephania yunnanensis]|uniref:Pentatricopeptide repeat-containing protein n=1 Tax=Stephania yunnanensis TaxID=152371 RepID=A0AAP0IV90_9MAGN